MDKVVRAQVVKDTVILDGELVLWNKATWVYGWVAV
jgi:hypothetical protein